MLSIGFHDTFRVAHPEERAAGTFDSWRLESGADKIDDVFAGPGIETTSTQIVRDRIDDRWPSDHAPVVATISID